MSHIQAVIFKKTHYTPKTSRDWLNVHGIRPMKRVHTTANYLRYRILPPRPEKKYYSKNVTPYIYFIFYK